MEKRKRQILKQRHTQLSLKAEDNYCELKAEKHSPQGGGGTVLG